MLGKLIKYDFNWINKVMYIYFVIMFFISLAVKIVESFDQNLLMVIIDKTVSCMFIACIFSIAITYVLRTWSRFITNFYKDESYLTHTLPVTKSQLFDSKIIASLLSMLMAIAVIIICVLIVFLNTGLIEDLKTMYNSLVTAYDSGFAILFVVGLVLIVLLELAWIMICGIFGIVAGHRFNNSKMLKSIIIGLITYGIMAIVIFAVIYFVNYFFIDIDQVVNGFPEKSDILIMGLSGIGVYLFANIFFYFESKHLLNKGVNVD